MKRELLREEAKRILLHNRIDDYTVPCRSLYPFQWNWDSGFTCLGLGQINLKLVIAEYHALFRGQWKNGMLPHIIFHSDQQEGYFPNASYWKSMDFSYSADLVSTSGITQPPVHGFILDHLLSKYPANAALKELAKYLYPKIIASHDYLYSDRDPAEEGLVYIYHPWESGRDNSPVWDEMLNRMKVRREDLPFYKRVDNSLANPDHRPTEEDYMKYVSLMETGRRNGYSGEGVSEESPFLVQDTLFNALLIASERSMVRIGKKFGEDTQRLEKRLEKSIRRFREKLWSSSLATFVCFDLRSGKQLDYKEIGGLTALFAEIAVKDQAEQMVSGLRNLIKGGRYYLQPSFDPESQLFDPKRYWKGPVWPQMNWLVYQGLQKYHYIDEAVKVKEDLIQLVSQHGFYEYFDPRIRNLSGSEEGYGGKEFSWTSAVILDLLS